MPKSTMPRARMKDNSAIDEMARAYEAMLPKEFGGTVNLFIHPMASAAAISAIGFGVASHAFGLWMGTMAGAAEASRRVFEAGAEAEQPMAAPPPRTVEKPRLELVSSNEGAGQAAAPARPAARTKVVAKKVAAKPRKRADVSSDAAQKAADTVAKLIETAVEPAPTTTTTTGPSKPKSMAKPDAVDDLKAISGVGPKLEQVLNKFGIWTYAQIAALDAGEIAWLDDELGFSGRIERDDWTGQARKLVSGQ